MNTSKNTSMNTLIFRDKRRWIIKTITRLFYNSDYLDTIQLYCNKLINKYNFDDNKSVRLRGHYGCVNSLTFNKEGNLLASGK